MAKKFFQRFMVDSKRIKEHRHLSQLFGELLHSPDLWHLNRQSVSRAAMVGLFCAFIPVPFQMVLAAGGALWLRANIVLAVGLVWVSNPVTMPPLFYFAYKVGSSILGIAPQPFSFELSWAWLFAQMHHNLWPFLLGCAFCGLAAGLAGSLAVRIFWRVWVQRHWRRRCESRLSRP